MDYEKAYKEALKEAVIAHKDEDKHLKATLERIFPELKESKDEKIRKAILELVRQSSEILDKQNQNNMIAWLEKQGEQKPKEEIKTTAYGTFGEYGVVEYVYILDYCSGRVIVAKHEIKESIEDFFEKLGLKESQCHYMVSSDVLSIEYINF